MSKAFTQETHSDQDEQEVEKDLALAALPQRKNYITPKGFHRLKEELSKLLNQERPDLVQVVSWAAGNGDRSENGDYIYGKRKLREIDRRIRFLSKRLEIAEVIDPKTLTSRHVQFGASVTYQNEAGIQKKICIVGIDEIEPQSGKISWISPLAKALLHHVVGDVVSFQSPKGEEELEILKVEYQDLP